ncbi:MAG: hypothetical protein CL610_22505 [Anaerolineaceae bacterium]|nr:hypothetical protein [Anaerolineaceae bacterium]
MSFDQSFRFLDSETDRNALIADIRQVRQAVINMTTIVPEDQWYKPRYHDWSLAAMLGHLQFMDNAHMLLIQLALVGVRPPVSMRMVDRMNDVMAQVFRRRMVPTTIRGIEKKEKELADFIQTLPIDKFTTQVFYPPVNHYLTIEQALQVLFLHHWQNHLKTMQNVEGIQPHDASAN